MSVNKYGIGLIMLEHSVQPLFNVAKKAPTTSYASSLSVKRAVTMEEHPQAIERKRSHRSRRSHWPSRVVKRLASYTLAMHNSLDRQGNEANRANASREPRSMQGVPDIVRHDFNHWHMILLLLSYRNSNYSLHR